MCIVTGLQDLRNYLTKEVLEDKDSITANLTVLKVISKQQESKVVMDFITDNKITALPGTGGRLVKLSDTLTKGEYNFLNTVLTNMVNSLLITMVGKVWIDSYSDDIEDLLAEAQKDSRLQKFVMSVNLMELFENSKKIQEDVNTLYGLDDVLMLGVSKKIKVHLLPKFLVPNNKELDKGKVFKIPVENPLYDHFKLSTKVEKEFLAMDIEGDKIYHITNSVYGYPTIRRTNLTEFFSISTFNPEEFIL